MEEVKTYKKKPYREVWDMTLQESYTNHLLLKGVRGQGVVRSVSQSLLRSTHYLSQNP